jgi:dienelactone hydrolase
MFAIVDFTAGSTSVPGLTRRSAIRLIVCLLFGGTVALPVPCASTELAQPEGIFRELVSIPFTQIGALPLQLDGIVTRPSKPGRYPLVLINHGSADPPERPGITPSRFTAIAIHFARRGWVAAAVSRRGYGRSEGTSAEALPGCARVDYQAAAMATAQDIIQSAKFFQTQPYVDPTRLLLVGHSAGGFGSIAVASLAPKGLVGVINFAGGRGSAGSPDTVCREDLLIESYAKFGKTVRVPTLWICAANDHFFGPKLAHEMFVAFTQAGAPGEFVIAPPFGQEGHFLFPNGEEQWRDNVDDFLRKYSLPTWARPVKRQVPDLPVPPGANAKMASDFYLYLVSENYEKAFVMGANGYFAWFTRRRTPEDAIADGLKLCFTASATCKPYAVNDMLTD